MPDLENPEFLNYVDGGGCKKNLPAVGLRYVVMGSNYRIRVVTKNVFAAYPRAAPADALSWPIFRNTIRLLPHPIPAAPCRVTGGTGEGFR